MAVGIMDLVHPPNPTPLTRHMIPRVHQDGSRHAAFGVLSMRRLVKESTQEERDEMEDFAYNILETLNANQQLDMLRLFGAKYDLDGHAVVQMMHNMEMWPAINSEAFMHTVMPNLMRLGLITERTEEKYRERGMLIGDHLVARAELPGT